MHIENVVIGSLMCSPSSLFAYDIYDWLDIEIVKTHFTNERYLPKILVDVGFVKSANEVRRNKPQYNITLDKIDFILVKWGKKKLYIGVGE